MFRLPVCPHCGTVYRYRDTKAALRNKKNACYHCKKGFRARLLPYIAAEILILLPVCIGFNVLLLFRMEKLNLIILFAVTVGFLLLGYLLSPFFIHFQKTDHSSEKSETVKQINQKQSKNQTNSVKNQNKQQKNKKRRS